MSAITVVIDEIDRAIGVLKLNVLKFSSAESVAIASAAKAKFVNGNPRVWWLSLHRPYQTFSVEDHTLLDVIPAGTVDVWFMPEYDWDESATVYRTNVESLQRLLNECFLFEYYVLQKDYDWVICANDHDEYYFR